MATAEQTQHATLERVLSLSIGTELSNKRELSVTAHHLHKMKHTPTEIICEVDSPPERMAWTFSLISIFLISSAVESDRCKILACDCSRVGQVSQRCSQMSAFQDLCQLLPSWLMRLIWSESPPTSIATATSATGSLQWRSIVRIAL